MTASPEPAGSPNNVNDLFDYDVGLDEIFAGTNTSNNKSNAPKPAGDPSSLGLGLDEEVKVTKKRQPVAKLDEGRLLSQPGIPKLRRAAKQKLKFKGRGHEFSDAARLLNFYQLWLDDLFPRAKFADGLAMIEKLGHTKRMQTMRREWIDEEKRKMFEEPETEQQGPAHDLPTRLSSDQNGGSGDKPETNDGLGSADDLFIPDPEGASKMPASHPVPEEDDLDDLLREQDEPNPPAPGPTLAAPRMPASHPEPEEDDLDDLLREQDKVNPPAPKPTSAAPPSGADDFDAEYEAMMDMGM